ncbi:MAG TPA: hypothetical protein VF857_10005 [Spirochaetota bacterium]
MGNLSKEVNSWATNRCAVNTEKTADMPEINPVEIIFRRDIIGPFSIISFFFLVLNSIAPLAQSPTQSRQRTQRSSSTE